MIKKNRARRWVANAVTLIVSIFLSMAMMEGYIRLTQPISVSYVYSPLYDYRMKSNMDFRFKTAEFDTRVTTDAFGLRGHDADSRRPCRVMMLGDSFVFGHGVNDDETFSHLLQERLDVAFPGMYSVINAGVNGYDTIREGGLYQELADVFHPDLTLVNFVANDPLSNSGEYVFSPTAISLLRFIPFSGVASLLEYAFRSPTDLLHNLGLMEGSTGAAHFACLNVGACQKAWQATGAALARIGVSAQRYGSRMIVVNLPLSQQLPGEIPPFPADGAVAGQWLSAFSGEIGAYFIDLRQAKELTPNHYYRHDGHMRAIGHEVVAERLFNPVVELTGACRNERKHPDIGK